MATIVLDYDVHNEKTQKALELGLSLGLFKIKKKKTGLEKAFEDIEEGRITFINVPKKHQ